MVQFVTTCTRYADCHAFRDVLEHTYMQVMAKLLWSSQPRFSILVCRRIFCVVRIIYCAVPQPLASQAVTEPVAKKQPSPDNRGALLNTLDTMQMTAQLESVQEVIHDSADREPIERLPHGDLPQLRVCSSGSSWRHFCLIAGAWLPDMMLRRL